MKIALGLFCLFNSLIVFGQQEFDKKIIIKVIDSNSIYEKLKTILVINDFIVKEFGRKDTLSTYSREAGNVGYAIANLKLEGSIIILTGIYGTKKLTYTGYSNPAKNYQPISFYKGSKSWKLLMNIANSIGGEISYSK